MENLLGVVIGGLIAIVGGAVSPWIQHRMARKEREAIAKRDSTKSLIEAIYLHAVYEDLLRQKWLFATEVEIPLNPLSKIEGIVLADFPDNYPQLTEFKLSTATLEDWFIGQGKRRINGEPLVLDDYRDLIRRYNLDGGNLIAAISGRNGLTLDDLDRARASAL